jgi:hypothetical protein
MLAKTPRLSISKVFRGLPSRFFPAPLDPGLGWDFPTLRLRTLGAGHVADRCHISRAGFACLRAGRDTRRNHAVAAGARIVQTHRLRHRYKTLCRMVDDRLLHTRQQFRHEPLYGAPPSEAPGRRWPACRGPRTAPDRPKRLTAIQTHSSGMGGDRRVGVQGGGDSRVDERLQAGGGVGALGADERRVELRSVINVVGVQSLFPGASSRSIFIMRRKNLSVKDSVRSNSSSLGKPDEPFGCAAGAPDNLLLNSAFSRLSRETSALESGLFVSAGATER